MSFNQLLPMEMIDSGKLKFLTRNGFSQRCTKPKAHRLQKKLDRKPECHNFTLIFSDLHFYL